MPNIAVRKRSEKGSTLVLFTVLLTTFILPGVGLAIDGTIAFVAKAKLAAAADAAALAGARALSLGPDQPSQAQAATAAAKAYFKANFTMASTDIDSNPSGILVQRSGSIRNVTVTVTAQVPVYFMRILNFQQVSVRAISTASRRDVNLMLVLDRSYSMAVSGVCPTMTASAQLFVDKFASGSDKLGLITFMGAAYQDFPSQGSLSTDFQPTLKTIIGKIACNGVTGTAAALSLAYNQFINPDGTLRDNQSLNVIVLYTDGQPDAISGNFTIQDPQTCTSQPVPSNFLSGIISGSASGTITYAPVGVLENMGIASSNSGTLQLYGNQPLQPSEAQGCNFQQNSPSNIGQMPLDVSSIPPSDLWGNSTALGGSTPTNPGSASDVQAAAINAASNAANQIRQKNILIYAIGESSNVNTSFLEQIANVPQSQSYNSSQAAGYYVHAPTGSQLASAFNTIALQILRLSQ